jgi:hypothetical protein
MDRTQFLCGAHALWMSNVLVGWPIDEMKIYNVVSDHNSSFTA